MIKRTKIPDVTANEIFVLLQSSKFGNDDRMSFYEKAVTFLNVCERDVWKREKQVRFVSDPLNSGPVPHSILF